MASLTGSRHLFFTTSPRSPMKIIPEIELLGKRFSGKKWDKESQKLFMQALIDDEIYEGKGPTDMSLAGRDRINRAPKSLGLVNLKPKIELTEAGRLLIESEIKEEVFLRQLLKFQLPSPYHKKSGTEENKFHVKPYLEIIRLIRKFGSLTFDEIMLFGLQLKDYRDFDKICSKIDNFRVRKAKTSKNYQQFIKEEQAEIILELFDYEISNNLLFLRESRERSINKYIKTKSATMRDYTDACFRYLIATGLMVVSHRNSSLSIKKEKLVDVDFFLDHVGRAPKFIDDLENYQEYLFNPELPVLYSDDKVNLIKQLKQLSVRKGYTDLEKLSIFDLKELLHKSLENKKDKILEKEIQQIKNYEIYDDIIMVYKDIGQKNLYDLPLMLEWNTWRAMTMLDGGEIIANLKFDDNGQPMSTAIGNKADILCDYGEFILTVEVTLSSGARQYEMEGEPVARHLANHKKETNKKGYCLFIAPTINEACISHFYMLHKTNINFYGGKSIIVPLKLATFKKMLEDSYKADYTPQPEQVESIFKFSEKIANEVDNETEWFTKLDEKALNWLA